MFFLYLLFKIKANELLIQRIFLVLKELLWSSNRDPRTPSTQKATPMCPKCGKPATWIEAYKRWYCYSCQEYLEA